MCQKCRLEEGRGGKGRYKIKRNKGMEGGGGGKGWRTGNVKGGDKILDLDVEKRK